MDGGGDGGEGGRTGGVEGNAILSPLDGSDNYL